MASSSQSQSQQQRAESPHRTIVWTEPNKSSVRRRKVQVVYYLCRDDGQLEHPHFMEVPLVSDNIRLCLRDFTERLDMLRGRGMAAMYSWSSKRSYKNQGFVWHDLTEDDVIHPANCEYVLKGSQRLASTSASASFSSSSNNGQEQDYHTTTTMMAASSRRNWSRSLDLADHQYNNNNNNKPQQLSMDEISPPSSSPDEDNLQEELFITTGGRMRASSVLMQLISCGSITTLRLSTNNNKKNSSQLKNKMAAAASFSSSSGGDSDNGFSGGLVTETNNRIKKKTSVNALSSLKRSSSCNAAGTRSKREEKPTGSRA